VTDIDHRALAVALFNQAWDLIDLADRTPAQDLDMVVTACASRRHWQEAGGIERNLVVADWQVAHTASLAGLPDLALRFASAAVNRAAATDLPAWLLASTHEALARAHAVAGDRPGYEREAAIARGLLDAAEPGEDRDIIESQLASIPAPA
jgi:hypothetical protein